MMSIAYEDLRRAADMAPSILNTKPWSLSGVADHRIELRAEWRRSLEAVDPRHRELFISCGAALFNVRMAIRVTGHDLAYSLVPGEQDTGDACPRCQSPGLLASVEIALHGVHPATEDEQRLYEAIPVSAYGPHAVCQGNRDEQGGRARAGTIPGGGRFQAGQGSGGKDPAGTSPHGPAGS
jgi:hypothetical protein